MTQFVGVKDMTRWITRDGAPAIIRQIASVIENDLARWESFDKIPRVASHTPGGVIELMPISDNDDYSFKYVNGHPTNPARGFQTVVAFGVLSDVATGYPVFMSEMTLLTALRTAAMSAVAAQHLAPAGAIRMAMIGAGSQAEFQALGMRELVGIQELFIYDTDARAVKKLRNNLEPLGFRIKDADSVEDALEGADIITTCTADKQRAHVLTTAQVGPGVHINAIGGDCPGKTELDADILHRSRVFVEFEEQTRIEGELQQVPHDFPVTELWEVVTGRAHGRRSGDEITVFDSVGFALADFCALKVCREATAGTDLQVDIDLVAEPADPKDLYSLLS
ncbi:ornithine cyclodeaminase [Flaviflexus equikiangi]|uniref:ornithine cyclodeaminase n=1 Tax=Flaviflexus equikiangi TaxID=2758573 RepID=UPI0015F5B1E0|nr:ornithine cyclodeaminase [Flaviflexus equikiangi]